MAIYVNQVGYDIRDRHKTAVVHFQGNYCVRKENGNIVWTGKSLGFDEKGEVSEQGKAMADPLSLEELYLLDFADIKENGTYYVEGPMDGSDAGRGSMERSVTFHIGHRTMQDVHEAMIKALYYQRCGIALDEKYAGPYKHKKCHMEPSVVWGEPDKIMDATGGWHDAGDYGRYVTPGAVTVAHLLYAYEMYPAAFKGKLNIPESGNGIPDVLNECKYELDWFFKMQCKDGAVYHKLTGWRHAPFIMPEEDQDQFYFYPVSSMAVADFCACMAQAARVYKNYDSAFALKASEAAWRSYQWLLNNPEPLLFKNPEDSGTGGYYDGTDADERLWAMAELLLLASSEGKDTKELKAGIEKLVNTDMDITSFGWGNVSGFATMTLLLHGRELIGEELVKKLEDAVFNEAEKYLEMQKKNAFRLSMEPQNFGWGSSMTVTNRGILFALAYRLADEKGMQEEKHLYEDGVKYQMDFILGKNAADISFVTGFGDHAYKNPHLRPTFADDVEDPMPGWVSGGPNATKWRDPLAKELIPDGTAPMKSYVDRYECYSLNEITIYWNSSAVFDTAFLLR